MNREETLIILGDSPFLGEVQGSLQSVLDAYPSMGINVVIMKYRTKYQIFQDFRIASIADKFPDIRTVTTFAAGRILKKENKELVDSFSFSFLNGTSDTIVKDGKLGWCSYTHDYAVSWAIWKGFKRVILIGAADFIKGPHHTLGGNFVYSRRTCKDSVRFLSEFCSKRIEIFTCNPKSLLTVPRIDINELI